MENHRTVPTRLYGISGQNDVLLESPAPSTITRESVKSNVAAART